MVGHPVQRCVVALRTQRAALVENHGTHRCHAPPRPGGPPKFFLPEVGTIQILYHCDFYLEKNDTCHFCPTQVTCFTLPWTNISHRCIMGKSRVPFSPPFMAPLPPKASVSGLGENYDYKQMNLKTMCRLFIPFTWSWRRGIKKKNIYSGLRWEDLTKRGTWKLLRIIKMFCISVWMIVTQINVFIGSHCT